MPFHHSEGRDEIGPVKIVPEADKDTNLIDPYSIAKIGKDRHQMKRFGKVTTKTRTKGILGSQFLLGSAFVFSLMTVCVKYLGGRLPVTEIVLTRALIGIFITRIMIAKAGISPWGYQKGLLLVRGLLGTAGLFCVFKALANLPLASATVIQYTYPTFATLAAWFLLGERLRKRIVFAVIIGWAGIMLVVQPSWIGFNLSTLPAKDVSIALAGAILTALAYVCVRKLSKKEHPLVIVHYFPLVSIIITIPFLWGKGLSPNGIEWFWLLSIGILSQIGQVLITKGLSLIPAAQACSISYAQVLFAFAWGLLIFNESINKWMLIGASFVFISTLISISSRVKDPNKVLR